MKLKASRGDSPQGLRHSCRIPTGYEAWMASACHTKILEIPCLVLSQKMLLSVSFNKLLVELAQAAGPSLAALAWSCSFRGHISALQLFESQL